MKMGLNGKKPNVFMSVGRFSQTDRHSPTVLCTDHIFGGSVQSSVGPKNSTKTTLSVSVGECRSKCRCGGLKVSVRRIATSAWRAVATQPYTCQVAQTDRYSGPDLTNPYTKEASKMKNRNYPQQSAYGGC